MVDCGAGMRLKMEGLDVVDAKPRFSRVKASAPDSAGHGIIFPNNSSLGGAF